jgi:hypothetical protein
MALNETSAAHRLVGDTRLSRGHRSGFDGELLALGGEINLPDLAWHDDPARPCAAVLLAGTVSAADLSAAVDVMPDPAVPIADFAGNDGTRRDFAAKVLDWPTLTMVRAQFAPILRRLAELPFRAPRQDRGDMLVLRLAYSRASAIEASFIPSLPNLIDYPLLAGPTPKRAELEQLAFRDLLRRRHFIRTHACGGCTSNRLLAFEACHACGSSNLVDEPIVHHYRCGFQAAESGFLQGSTLICPKCRRPLRHFGMDYGKPGLVVCCSNCGANSPEPDPRFICLDCTAIASGHLATTTDWFHYDLTDAGLLAQRYGRLPDTPAPSRH